METTAPDTTTTKSEYSICLHFLTCPFTHTYRIFTTCTLPQVAVIQYAPHGTSTSHTFTHTARPPPHTNYFTYQDWKETHPHLYAESPATNYTRDNKSRTSRAEDKFHQTSIPLKTSSIAHINNSNSIRIILKTTRPRYKL
jgi:hypothetical protein